MEGEAPGQGQGSVGGGAGPPKPEPPKPAAKAGLGGSLVAGFLEGCRASGSRVGVVTRHPRGVRGVITGTVLTYDVHMNMILQDCAESYSELHLFRDEAKGRFRRKQKHFTRRMKQVMLKGDSVVLLHKVAETRLLPPGGEGAPPG